MPVGPTIGAYRVLQKIGEGGMGEVFLAEHTLLGRQAAIKVLLPEMSVQPYVERFFNEAKATTAVSDPGIVQVFDFGFTPEGIGYIVMEYLVGEPLDKRLDRLGVLPVVDALRLVRQVAGSMAAAHAAGIVHRDLKPDNIVVVRDPAAPGGERPKILDFGIAKLGDTITGGKKTRTGSLLGTPVYMSPEQCDGRVDVDHRADIYSLGCVLFYLVTGRPPFDLPGAGPAPVMLAHLSEPAPAPSSVAQGLPRALDEIVLRCLAKAPKARYPSMLELQAACDALLARAHALPTITAASELPAGHAPSDRRTVLWLAACAVAIAVGVGAAIAITGGAAPVNVAAPVRAPAPAATVPSQAMTVTAPPPPARPAPVTTSSAPPAPAPVQGSAAATPGAATVTRPKHPPKRAPHPRPDPATDPNDDVYGDR